jgi:RNA polymerase-binding protein DksA
VAQKSGKAKRAARKKPAPVKARKTAKAKAPAAKRAPARKAASRPAQRAKAPVSRKVAAKPAARPAAKRPASAVAKKTSVAAKPAVRVAVARPAPKPVPVKPTPPKPTPPKPTPPPSAKVPARGKASAGRSGAKSAAPSRPAPSAGAFVPDAEFIANARRKLQAKREEILALYRRDLRSGQESNDSPTEDIVDRANNAYTRELTYSISDSERALLFQIDEALARIDAGTYGVCVHEGNRIGRERLEAIPWARYCIESQELAEKGLLPES